MEDALLIAISSVAGPLTLVAFLAVIVLAMFRRSVKDERGLEYIYNLFKDRLTRKQFYNVTRDIIRYTFWLVIVVFTLSIVAFVATVLMEPTNILHEPTVETAEIVTATPTLTEGGELPENLAGGILRVKVFNFDNYSSAALQQRIGERFPGLVLDQLSQKEITFSNVDVDGILQYSLHIFQQRGGPDYEDAAYYNQLAPAVIVQGYIEDSVSQPDTFVAHVRVSLIERQLSNTETTELAQSLQDETTAEMPALKLIMVEEVTFEESTMRAVSAEIASEIYAQIKLRTDQLNDEAEELISELDTDSAQTAMEELVRLGPVAIPSLVRAASDNNEELRLHAIHVLGELREPALLPVYASLLQYDDSATVSATLTSLWKLADNSKTPVVEDDLSQWRGVQWVDDSQSLLLFGEPDFSFSFLRESRLPRANVLSPVLPQLITLLSSEQEISAYRSAIILSEAQDLAPMSEILTSIPKLPSDSHRNWAVLMLGKLGCSETITQLEELAQHDQDLSTHAIIYLGWMGVRAWDEELLELLGNSHPVVQSAAAGALEGTEHPDAPERLAEVIHLREAQETLVTLNAKAVSPVLDALTLTYSQLPDGEYAFGRDDIYGAKRVLESIGPAAYPYLRQVLYSDADARIKYSVASVIEDQCSYDFSRSPFVSEIGEDKLIDDLIEILLNTEVDEEHRMLRLSLVQALEGIASNRAVPGLRQALERETSDQVQGYILWAIEECE